MSFIKGKVMDINYKNYNSGMRIGLFFIFCTLCVLLSSCSPIDKKGAHIASSVIKDGDFLENEDVLKNVYENYRFMKDGKVGIIKETDITTVFETDNGRLELYFFTGSLCLNAFWKSCEQQYDLEDVATFVQCFYEDKTYNEILNFMKKQCGNRPNNEYVMGVDFAVDNILFNIADIELEERYEKDGYEKGIFLQVLPECIYYDKQDPKQILHYLSIREEDVYNEIENMSYSQARQLIDYYRNHEVDDIRGITSLCKAADFDMNMISTEIKQDYSTSQDYSYTEHWCEQCGKSASHSIRGLNGYDEWYCDEHWNEMQNMFDYMMDN